jgi:hypothetical protein
VKTKAEEREVLVAKVKAFLDKNYSCCGVAGCCGEEEEARAIVDIMEAAGFGPVKGAQVAAWEEGYFAGLYSNPYRAELTQ